MSHKQCYVISHLCLYWYVHGYTWLLKTCLRCPLISVKREYRQFEVIFINDFSGSCPNDIGAEKWRFSLIFERNSYRSTPLYDVTVTLYQRHGVWTHRRLDCLYNSLLSLRTKQYQRAALQVDSLTKAGNVEFQDASDSYAWVNGFIGHAVSHPMTFEGTMCYPE